MHDGACSDRAGFPYRRPQWFDDAEPDVVAAARAAVGLLQEAGLEVVEIKVPELGLLTAAHSVTFVSELKSNLAGGWMGVGVFGLGVGWRGVGLAVGFHSVLELWLLIAALKISLHWNCSLRGHGAH